MFDFLRESQGAGGTIPYGTQGVIITCDGGKERGSARDAARNLTERFEIFLERDGKSKKSSSEDKGKDESADAGDALRAELEGLREDNKQPLFKENSVDLRACTFVAASKEVTSHYTMAELVRAELERAKESGKTFARHMLRMIPVETTCYAGVDEIAEAAAPLIEKYFGDEKERTFAICFDRRANSSVRRNDVIEAIAKQVKQPPAKVNLGNPDLTIMVEVIKGVACLSVLTDYESLCKYNVRFVAMTEEERIETKNERSGITKPPPAEGSTKKQDDEKKE